MAKIKSAQFVGVTLEEHERSLKLIDGTNEPVLALHRVYPTGHRTPPHNHTRVQIWCARRGVVLVSTADGPWPAQVRVLMLLAGRASITDPAACRATAADQLARGR